MNKLLQLLKDNEARFFPFCRKMQLSQDYVVHSTIWAEKQARFRLPVALPSDRGIAASGFCKAKKSQRAYLARPLNLESMIL